MYGCPIATRPALEVPFFEKKRHLQRTTMHIKIGYCNVNQHPVCVEPKDDAEHVPPNPL